MDKSAVSELVGVEAVTQWFEGWPSFHDAEVISIFLARKGESVLHIYPYHPQKPATVSFIFEDVTDIDLNDFSRQNVIFDLEVGTSMDQDGGRLYCVTLDPCYGVAGKINAKSLRFELVPGKSSDGVSLW